MTALYRLVYASKNVIAGTQAEAEAEVGQILAASRRNNARAGVSGALMFNGGAFAQVLEGPQRSVEDTFERIQRDPRHGEVTVLECRPVDARGFPDWSMAFVGQSERGRTLWGDLAARSGFDPARLDGDAVFAMLHSLVLDEEGVPVGAGALPGLIPAAPADAPDAAVTREETGLQSPASATPATRDGTSAPGPAEVWTILTDALSEERGRTTELRGTIDGLRVALFEARAERDDAQAERDLWIQRTRVLAAALCDGPRRSRAAIDGTPPAVAAGGMGRAVA